jgi:hypothetical protein
VSASAGAALLSPLPEQPRASRRMAIRMRVSSW